MRTVFLYGKLKKIFGSQFKFDVSSPREAVKALCSQLKSPLFEQNFSQVIREGSYKVIRGKKKRDNRIDEKEISINFGHDQELHLIPVVKGSKSGVGIGKIVLGVALVATAVAIPVLGGVVGGLGATAFAVGGATVTYGNLALIGASMLLSGVASLLSPTPQVGDYSGRERPEDRPSFFFSGAVNQQQQGGCIPLAYGLCQVGSVIVSRGIQTEKIL